MMKKDSWRNSNVAVIGAGNFGTVLANLVAANSADVRVWLRSESQARAINATRSNPNYISELELAPNIRAFSDLGKVFEVPVHVIIWALPSKGCRIQAKNMAPLMKGDEIVLHATKGVEPDTLKRISTVLAEELPVRRIGVISGPNLATELARKQPAATVVASRFNEVVVAGQELLKSDFFRVYGATDVAGIEWAGTLKNILAIAAGSLDSLGFGWNSRAMLLSRGLVEMVRFGKAMGAQEATFLGIAGVGDLFATCSSPSSRNYQVGYRLARGESLPSILKALGSTAEGVRTARSIWEYARGRGIYMPITEAVYHVLKGEFSVQEALHKLMTEPLGDDFSLDTLQ